MFWPCGGVIAKLVFGCDVIGCDMIGCDVFGCDVIGCDVLDCDRRTRIHNLPLASRLFLYFCCTLQYQGGIII